jgi:endoglucanase
LHHFDELIASPTAEQPRFVAIWAQLAARYRDRPASLKYELLNEPNGPIDAQWNMLYPSALAAVRAVDPDRTVILDATSWASARTLSSLKIVDDPALVVTFHMYEPILFTHQGASWMPAEYQTKGVIFPGPPCAPLTPAPGAMAVPWVTQWLQSYNQQPNATNPSSAKAVEDIFAAVDTFIARTGRAVYLGEFAAGNKADPASRERWVRLIREHAEARSIPWAYWDDGDSNQAYTAETGEWIPYLKRALFDAAE